MFPYYYHSSIFIIYIILSNMHLNILNIEIQITKIPFNLQFGAYLVFVSYKGFKLEQWMRKWPILTESFLVSLLFSSIASRVL